MLSLSKIAKMAVEGRVGKGGLWGVGVVSVKSKVSCVRGIGLVTSGLGGSVADRGRTQGVGSVVRERSFGPTSICPSLPDEGRCVGPLVTMCRGRGLMYCRGCCTVVGCEVYVGTADLNTRDVLQYPNPCPVHFVVQSLDLAF